MRAEQLEHVMATCTMAAKSSEQPEVNQAPTASRKEIEKRRQLVALFHRGWTVEQIVENTGGENRPLYRKLVIQILKDEGLIS